MTPSPAAKIQRTGLHPVEVENALNLVEAKLTLHTALALAKKERGKAMRALFSAYLGGVDVKEPLKTFLTADKAFDDAEENVLAVSQAEMQSQALIYKQMLKELKEPQRVVAAIGKM